MPEEQKQCSKCGESKKLDEFRRGYNQCRLCTNIQRQGYSERNKEARNKYSREYHQKNKEAVAARKRKHRQDNKESIIKYRQENKEFIVEYQRERRQQPENRERKRIQSINRRARQRSLSNTLTTEQWQHALNYFNGCCAVCNRQLNDMFGEFTTGMDHWIPLSYKGDDNPGTVAENIVPLCHGLGGCNNSKKDTMPDVWLEREFGKRKAKVIMKNIQEYFDSQTVR